MPPAKGSGDRRGRRKAHAPVAGPVRGGVGGKTKEGQAAGLSDEERLAIRESAVCHLETSVTLTDDVGRQWGALGDVLADGSRRGLEANALQRRIERAVKWCQDEGLPVRLVVLKGRRSGASTYCAKLVDLECRNQATKALMMADVFKRSDQIFGMAKEFATRDVFPWGFGVEPKAGEIRYGNHSLVVKETAQDPNAGRAGGYRVVHLSEVAHFPSSEVRNADTMMMALLPTVPKTPETMIFMESTANGRAGFFYAKWCAARWPGNETYWRGYPAGAANQAAGENDGELWVRVFAAWYEIPRNQMPVDEREREDILGSLRPRERAGVERWGWTAEQIKWRRTTLASDFSGREAQFDQEYPEDPESAFMASGSPAFSQEALLALATMAARAQAEWRHGTIEAQGVGAEEVLNGRWGDGGGVSFRQTGSVEEAWCSVLEGPRDGCAYLVTMDVASGAELTSGLNEIDRTSVLVLRRGYTEAMPDGREVWKKPRVVARLRREVMESPPTSRMVIYMLALLARYYGQPAVVVERNKGEWAIIGAQQAGLTVYRQQTWDRARNQMATALGFYMTEEHRHTLITTMQSMVQGSLGKGREGSGAPDVEIEDKDLVGELQTFVRVKGRYEAASGCHDDDVMSLGMGLLLLDQAVTYRVKRRRR